MAPPEQYLQERADAGEPGWSEETDDEESECYVKVLEREFLVSGYPQVRQRALTGATTP